MSGETQQPEQDVLSDDQLALHRYRYRAARSCGMTMRDAKLFAYSTISVGEMRALSEKGCPSHLLLRIL